MRTAKEKAVPRPRVVHYGAKCYVGVDIFTIFSMATHTIFKAAQKVHFYVLK